MNSDEELAAIERELDAEDPAQLLQRVEEQQALGPGPSKKPRRQRKAYAGDATAQLQEAEAAVLREAGWTGQQPAAAAASSGQQHGGEQQQQQPLVLGDVPEQGESDFEQDGQDDIGFDEAEAMILDEAAIAQREANRQLHAPEGPSAEQLAQLGALFVAQQAVYPDTTCCEDGCCEPAAVECRHCELVGVLRCAAHDAAAHCNAHEHHRLGVLGGFKQPLQPAQQYAAATSRCNCVCQHNHVVQQVPLFYPIAPLTPCSCGKGGQWQVDEGVSCGRTAATAKDGVGKPQQQPLIILTPKGRFDYNIACYQCSGCKRHKWQHWQEFTQLGLVPAAMGPLNRTYASRELLELARQLRFKGEVSWRQLAVSIDRTGQSLYGQATITNATTLEKAYQVHRLLQHHMEQCRGQRRWECPACADNLHSAHADGNMKLWVRDGRQINRMSRYEEDNGAVFVKDSEVAKLIEVVTKIKAPRQAKICGHSTFKAAGDRAGKAAGRLLSGRFMTACSHLLVLKMANMPAKYGGERYAYAWLTAAELKRRGCRFFFGDLVCKWWPWMLLLADKFHAIDRDELVESMLADLPDWLQLTRADIESMVAALSAVHSHTHVWYCQVLFSPLFKEGVGLENGEFMELVNAFMSMQADTGRQMSIGKSTDHLTEVAWDWNWLKVVGLAAYLEKRFNMAVDKAKDAHIAWCTLKAEIQPKYSVVLDNSTVETWGAEVVAAATAQLKRRERELTPSGQLMKLVICIQEAKALGDLVASFDAADVVLSVDTLCDVRTLVSKLQQQVPAFEKEVEMLKTTLQSHEARAADFAGSAAGSAAAGVPAGTPSASAVLQQLEQLVADLSAIVGDDSDVCNRLLTVCQQLAVTHSRLHRLTALVNSPQVQANWQQQLAESAILDYEDDMEAHYLLIQKNNAKFSSAGGLTSKEQKAVRDRISNLKASLQKTIDKHNTVRHLGLERRAQDVQLEQVLQGNFPWAFRGLDPQSSAVQGTPPVVPFQEKLKVWQAYNLEQRAEEQKIKVQQDAAAFVAYYQEVQQQMDSGVTLHSDWLSSYASMEEVQAGLKALKLSGMGFVKSQLKQGSDLQHKIGAPLF